MALSDEIKGRIFAAADQLYADSEDGEFPGVDAVRKLCRAAMGSVVEGMKEWRANQRKQVQAIREPLPPELENLLRAAGQSMWEAAQQRANEALETAKAAFEAEKADLAELSAQQSAAFEEQAALLEAAHVRIRELESQAASNAEQIKAIGDELLLVQSLHRDVEGRAALAEQKATDADSRANELRTELDRAHKDVDRGRQECDQIARERDGALSQLASAQSDLAGLKGRLEAAMQRMTEQQSRVLQAEGERDKAREAEIAAREAVASQRGQLGILEKQNTALLAAVSDGEKKPRAK